MDTLFNLNNYNLLPDIDNYEIFHDESKDNHIMHGFLLIPTRIRETLLQEIEKIRVRYNCDSKLHYNDLSGKKENCKTKTVKDVLRLIVSGMMRKKHEKNVWGDAPPLIKYILFKKKNRKKMDIEYYQHDGEQNRTEIDLRKIETLLRIGLKGGLHYLFNEEQKIVNIQSNS